MNTIFNIHDVLVSLCSNNKYHEFKNLFYETSFTDLLINEMYNLYVSKNIQKNRYCNGDVVVDDIDLVVLLSYVQRILEIYEYNYYNYFDIEHCYSAYLDNQTYNKLKKLFLLLKSKAYDEFTEDIYLELQTYGNENFFIANNINRFPTITNDINDINDFVNKNSSNEYIIEPNIHGVPMICNISCNSLSFIITGNNKSFGNNITRDILQYIDKKLIYNICKYVKNNKSYFDGNNISCIKCIAYINKKCLDLINKDRVNNLRSEYTDNTEAVKDIFNYKIKKDYKYIRIVFANTAEYLDEQSTQLNTLYHLGFPVINPKHCFKFNKNNINDAIDFINNFNTDSISYQINGFLIKSNCINSTASYIDDVNNKSLYKDDNVLKYIPKQKVYKAKIKDVITCMNKINLIDVYFKIDPIILDNGKIVDKVKIKYPNKINNINPDFNDFNIGDHLYFIDCNGEQIIIDYEFIRNDNAKNNITSIIENLKCPVCGEKISFQNNGTSICIKDYLIKNNKRILRRYNSVFGLDIESLNEEMINFLVDKKYVKFPFDVFKLSLDKINKKDLKGNQKKINSIIKHIEKIKDTEKYKVPLQNFLYASGIPNVYFSSCNALSRFGESFAYIYAKLQRFYVCDISKNSDVIDCANIISNMKLASVLYGYITPRDHDPSKDHFINEYGKLVGLSSQMNKKIYINNYIKNYNDNFISSINEKSDFIVIPSTDFEDAKVQKAKKLNIEIITDNDYQKRNPEIIYINDFMNEYTIKDGELIEQEV